MHLNRNGADRDGLLLRGEKIGTWENRLDQVGIAAGFLVPIGLVVGNLVFEAVIGVGGCCWFLRLILTRDRDPLKALRHPIVAAWLTWYGCILVSLIVNGPGDKGWAHDIVFFRYPLFTLSLLDISRRRVITRYLLYGLAAGVVFAILNTLSAHWIGFDFFGRPITRYTGKLKEASRISGMTAYAVPIFLTWGFLDEGLSKRMRYGVVSIGLIAFIQLLLTYLRTAILGALAGILFAAVFLLRRRVSTRAALGLVLIFIVSAGFFFQYAQMFSLESFYDRIYYWKVAWAMWKQHPLFGVGISSYLNAYVKMAESGAVSAFVAPTGQVFQLAETTHAHNLILMLLACTGIFGLASFLWLFAAVVRCLLADMRGSRVSLAAFPVVFLVVGATGFNIYHSWYQALLAFFMVLIGSPSGDDGNDENDRQ